MATANGHNVRIGELRPEFPCKNRGTALFSMKLRRRSILLMSTWFAVSLSYYGVFVYLPIRFASEGLGFMRGQYFLILVALVQIPGYALAAHGVEKWGRKPTLIGFLTLSSIGCVVYGAGQSVILIVGVTLLMSFALLGTWAAMYAFTPEVYPTHLRASGMGAAGAAARSAGLLAPSVIAPLMNSSFTWALSVLSGFLLAAAICVYLVEVETKGRALE
jgi:putative MFS transporter